jgi:hypothetical protein
VEAEHMSKMTRTPARMSSISSAQIRIYFFILAFIFTTIAAAHLDAQSSDQSNVRPAVTNADIQIVKRAREILNSSDKWNRADTRVCPSDAKTFSLYCALEMATEEVDGKFEHRGAAMQEARFVIEAITKHRKYEHRLMGYNNDPKTTFADIQKVLDLLEKTITNELAKQRSRNPQAMIMPSVDFRGAKFYTRPTIACPS